MESAIGGTRTLFCHIVTSESGRWSVARQFSAVPDLLFSRGVEYGELLPAAQFSLQQHLIQLNIASDGVTRRNLWAMSRCSSMSSTNVGFLLQCLPTAGRLAADRGAVAGLGPKPTMLYHLDRVGATYIIKYMIPVAEGHKPSTASVAYDQIDVEAWKVIASLISDANGNEPDLTKHPWALRSIWRLSMMRSLGVILEWQPASAAPQTATVGNVVPVSSSGTPAFGPLRPSSAREAGETASILTQLPSYEA